MRGWAWLVLALDVVFFVVYALQGAPFLYGVALSVANAVGLVMLTATLWALWVFISTINGEV